MTRIIAKAVAELKVSIRDALRPEIIHEACQEAKHTWRTRLLDPVPTIWMFGMQIVYANTACMHAVRLVPGIRASDSAYCQARSRIPLAAFRALLRLVAPMLLRSIDRVSERWHGHRVFLIDGSSCSMPDTPKLQAEFGLPPQQKKGCGFPMAKLLGLFHGPSGLLVDLLVSPYRTHEASIAHRLFHWLHPGDVLVGDRAFASYVILAMLAGLGVYPVMRQHQRRPVDFRRGRRIGVQDQIIELRRPSRRPDWMSADAFEALPERLPVRQLRYRIEENGYRTESVVLVTTLLDADAYPLDDLATLYGDRWEVETCFRHLKQTLHMDVLRCQTADGVRKELCMYGVIYDLIRAIMVQAGIRQEVPPDRISLIDVVRCLELGLIRGDVLPVFVVNPDRPGRHQPRAVKRRPKTYPLMSRPRQELRKALASGAL